MYKDFSQYQQYIRFINQPAGHLQIRQLNKIFSADGSRTNCFMKRLCKRWGAMVAIVEYRFLINNKNENLKNKENSDILLESHKEEGNLFSLHL